MAIISIFIYLYIGSGGWGYLADRWWIFAVVFVWNVFVRLIFLGHIKGNAIRVHENQLPEIYAIVKDYSEKLKLKVIPDLYLLQGNGVMNAFAVRLGGRNRIVVYSSILEAAYQEGMPAVQFVIGHELGHIKRNHVSFWRHLLIAPAKIFFTLSSAYSRACEYTCDNIGYSLCPEGAEKGLLILAAGERLHKNINVKELVANNKYNQDFATRFAERFSSHPNLMNRIESIAKQDAQLS